jgi:bacteriocin-like protein
MRIDRIMKNFTSKDELSEKELDKVTGGDKSSTTKGNTLPTESVSFNFTKIMTA